MAIHKSSRKRKDAADSHVGQVYRYLSYAKLGELPRVIIVRFDQLLIANKRWGDVGN